MRLARVALIAGLALAALAACNKDADPAAKKVATTSTGTVGADGVRTIAIEAGADGYVPERIPGKPGEKLKLVFTRTVDGECLAELKTPDGKLLPLPKGQAVEVPVTVPATGEIKFACGMDMFTGVVVASPT